MSSSSPLVDLKETPLSIDLCNRQNIKPDATSVHRLMTVWQETPDIGYL